MKKIIYADNFDYSLIKSIGFDGIFIKYDGDNDVRACKGNADKNGLILSSIHAPSKYCNYIYTDNPKPYIEQIKGIIALAGELGIKYVITHASLHIDTPPYSKTGAVRYKELCDFAISKGVTLCVENLEHPHILYLLRELYGYAGFGFCLDTGHNHAYTPQYDFSEFTPKYLHLNDNIGMTGVTYDGIDDNHLIPHDGTADFDSICALLNRQGYDGELTFELKKRNTHLYNGLTDREFLQKAFTVACDIEKKVRG